MASFWKPDACDQTVLPDRSVLIGQKLVENAKIQKFKFDILSNFQTMCTNLFLSRSNSNKFSSVQTQHLFAWDIHKMNFIIPFYRCLYLLFRNLTWLNNFHEMKWCNQDIIECNFRKFSNTKESSKSEYFIWKIPY